MGVLDKTTARSEKLNFYTERAVAPHQGSRDGPLPRLSRAQAWRPGCSSVSRRTHTCPHPSVSGTASLSHPPVHITQRG
jgi:hypothetical protein